MDHMQLMELFHRRVMSSLMTAYVVGTLSGA
ncbi:hypothetical protein TELCIR_16127 [Teladorsagia circumcincta]|uniref:Uncharacterized protein n=1 Tax=Teladorsagia circumcincta TaxID=45464 RepID=A0A2G9TWI5_TELCI|nr:hypothetical protein TELCIR_16127 [Teladorsagia circumcincta]